MSLKTCGFGKGGDTNLRSHYRTSDADICGDKRLSQKKSKKNEEYGWPVADFMLSEKLFGTEHVRSAYSLKPGKQRK